MYIIHVGPRWKLPHQNFNRRSTFRISKKFSVLHTQLCSFNMTVSRTFLKALKPSSSNSLTSYVPAGAFLFSSTQLTWRYSEREKDKKLSDSLRWQKGVMEKEKWWWPKEFVIICRRKRWNGTKLYQNSSPFHWQTLPCNILCITFNLQLFRSFLESVVTKNKFTRSVFNISLSAMRTSTWFHETKKKTKKTFFQNWIRSSVDDFRVPLICLTCSKDRNSVLNKLYNRCYTGMFSVSPGIGCLLSERLEAVFRWHLHRGMGSVKKKGFQLVEGANLPHVNIHLVHFLNTEYGIYIT